MNKKYKIILVLMLSVVILILGFIALGTTQEGLTLVRTDAGEDGDSLENVFNRRLYSDFGNKPASAWAIPDTDSESAANAIEFNFTTDGNGKTFSAVCYAWKSLNGPARMVCTIAATGGSQQVSAWPDTGNAVGGRNWVDTIVVTDRWHKTVDTGSSGDGNDIIATLWFDGAGCKWFKWYVYDADGSTGTEAGSVSIWGSYF